MKTSVNFPHEYLGFDDIVFKTEDNSTQYYPLDTLLASILYDRGGCVYKWSQTKGLYEQVDDELYHFIMNNTPLVCYIGGSTNLKLTHNASVEVILTTVNLVIDGITTVQISDVTKVTMKKTNINKCFGYIDFIYVNGKYVRLFIDSKWKYDLLSEIVRDIKIASTMTGQNVMFNLN